MPGRGGRGSVKVGGFRRSGDSPLVHVATATWRRSLPHPPPGPGELGPLAVKETVPRTQSPRSQQAPPGKTTSWLWGTSRLCGRGYF